MAGHGEKLSRRMEDAIAALLTVTTVKAAAKKVGVAERTLRTWMKRPDFERCYRQARLQVMRQAITGLLSTTAPAVRALKRLLQSKHDPTVARAALGLIAQAVQALELQDLAQELDDLRLRMEELEHERGTATGSRAGPTAPPGEEDGGPSTR